MPDLRSSRASALWVPLSVAGAYYFGARLGFALTLQPTPVSTLWPPNALLLSGLLLSPPQRWLSILAATLVAHLAVQLTAGVPLPMVLCWFISNCTEAVLAAVLVRRFGGASPAFDRFKYVLVFIGCAAIGSPFLSSFLDVAFVQLNRFGSGDYWILWRTRFFSNVLASLSLVPVVVIVATDWRKIRAVPLARWIEASVGMLLLTGTAWAVFMVRNPVGTAPALTYAVMPLRLGAALRFGAFGTSLSSLVCALMAIWGAVSGKGPFVASSPLENALSMQIFLIVSHVSLMLLAAVMAEASQAEQMARTNERQLELALSAARLVPWEWHIAADRTRGSRALWDMLGIPEPQERTAERYLACVHPDDRHIASAALANAIAGVPFDVEYRVLHPDGSVRWLLTRGTTTFDESGAAERVVGVNVDITERKRAETEIQERQREVAHLGRVSVVGELSMALTHELRQPLAAILANANAGQRLLSHTPPKLQEIREILGDIAADDARAAAVITRLRTLLRNEPVSRETMDVNQAVREALVIARADLAWRHVSVETRLSPRLPTIDADRVQVQQVLLNLVINACEAMENGHAGARRVIVSTGVSNAKMVEITVSDTGPGIAADRLEEIFAPFVTTKRSGLGLGLSICRSIVSAQGGRLHASNNTGGGASFHLSMPSTRTRADS